MGKEMRRPDVLCNVVLWLVSVSSVSAGEDTGPWLLKMPDHGYLSTDPPTKWEEGLLTGNGTLGALAMGNPWKERIILSHEELFLPKNSPTGAPDLGGHLERFGKLILAGKTREQ